MDGQLLPGDQILIANEVDLRQYSLLEAGILLKTVQVLTMTLGRVKCVSRSTSPSEGEGSDDRS